MPVLVIDDELAQQIRDAGEKVGLVDRQGKPSASFACSPSKYIERRRKELEPIRRRFREHLAIARLFPPR